MHKTEDPYDLSSQAASKADADKAAELAAKVEADDLRFVMSDKRGRRVVHRLLVRAGVFRTSFNTNALAMAFAEGQRNEGLRLVDQLNAVCQDRYFDMLKEAKK